MKKKKIVLLLSMMIAFNIQSSIHSFADDNINEYPAYMKGYPDGSFKPSNNVTRAEVAVIISSLIRNGEEIDSNIEFSDVKKNNWAYESVNYLRSKGIISGENSGKYNINDKMTRSELCSVIVKAYNLTKEDNNIKDFADIQNDINKEYIDIVVSNGYMNGYPDGDFKPNKEVTRAEIVSIINEVTGRENDIEDLKKMSINLSIPTDVKSNHWAYANILSSINNLKENENLYNNTKEISSDINTKNLSNKSENKKIDYRNLKDGEYNLSVELLKSDGENKPSEKSMADNALEDTAVLKVVNGKAKLYITMMAMELKGFDGQKGHLESAWYYSSKEDYLKYISSLDKNLLKPVEIVEEYIENSKKYPKIIAFPVEEGEEFVYIKVEVDIMKALGGLAPDAVVKIDWNSIER